ncbi:hypothetical protein QOZ80_6AG0517380 [Eleusine coracana subsp. coracana]|nr:hypothetical protein QOZ80_6AG0517380 [Eleusine coracana subsp. coracana]
MKQPTCLPEGEDINENNSGGLNEVQVTNHENNVPVTACSSWSWFPNAPTMVQQASQVTHINHGTSQSSYLPSQAPGPVGGSLENFIEIMEVQQAYLCALNDPDQVTPMRLIHQSPQALRNHYADDIRQMSHSGKIKRTFGSSQMQHSRWDNINYSGGVQQTTRSPMDKTFRIICIKGQISALCANSHGSRLIQDALETATPEEIIMVYEEIIPYARILTMDAFANYTIHKLLEYGPQFYKRKFISNLIGHVIPLSLHINGCRVIQKSFEVADHEVKVQMANEFCGRVLKCAHDQYANHVLQKCMECVPAQHIQFIFRSFCRKAEEFSATSYGCHVIKKVLTFCNNPQIYQTLVSEIMEAVVKLASDPFGNYVVQHIIEHGGPVDRSLIVKKLNGHFLSMSYQKHASNVIEKCLTFGNLEDRRLITTEILTGEDSEHIDHLLDMICNMYANFVIQKLVTAADKGQLRMLVEVAQRNMDTIMKCPHGRQVLAHIQKVLTDRGMSSDIQGYVPGQSS